MNEVHHQILPPTLQKKVTQNCLVNYLILEADNITAGLGIHNPVYEIFLTVSFYYN